MKQPGLDFCTNRDVQIYPSSTRPIKNYYERMKRFSFYVLSLLIVLAGIVSACDKSSNSEPLPVVHTIKTFDKQRHAFGNGFNQAVEGVFDFPVDPTKVERIWMFVKLNCPPEGCNIWDMYANISVKDPNSDHWFEIGRYITPYGVDNSAVGKGFRIDVTDFKSLLTGEVTLRSFVEVWGSDGWLVTVNFEVTEGTPDYKYYQVANLLAFNQHSLAGIPYGEEHGFDLSRTVTIPEMAEATSLRTVITGWGHATPLDPDGRPCAEWCFRTHATLINGAPLFYHELKPLGCASNPINNQRGNWSPDRAGWCPGMAVPVRTDKFDLPMAGESFTYAYELDEWVNNFQSSADNKHAYYAISSYVIVKSNEPLERPVVN